MNDSPAKKTPQTPQMRQTTLDIAVLVSGGGTNLQALIDEELRMNGEEAGSCPYRICAVFSDRKDAYALKRAEAAGIPVEIVSPVAVMGTEKARTSSRDEKRLAVSNRVLECASRYGAGALVLAGFLTVLSGDVIECYSGRIINLHPALLPKFGGEGMWGYHVHEAVIAAGETESGCTVHLVDTGCDTGKILLQRRVPVLPGDTPETLYARIAPCEHEALVTGVKQLALFVQNN